MGGQSIDAGDYWESLREHRLPFFLGERALWRISVPQSTEPPQPSPMRPHSAPVLAQVSGWQAARQRFGTPPAPHTCPCVQLPQSTEPPQPLPM